MPLSAAALPMGHGDLARLRRWSSATQAAAVVVQRARILLLAAELGVSHSAVARVSAEHDLKPWQTETFRFSTDPELAGKVRDVVGLYLTRRRMRSC